MDKILIVSRTRMKNGVCVGGINMDTGEMIRLHNERGGNLSDEAPYEIGDIWWMNVEMPWNPRTIPHTEDRSTTPISKAGNIGMQGISQFIKDSIDEINIARGSLRDAFNGALQFNNGKCFVGEEQIPNYSTQFWIADCPLYHRVLFEKSYYNYNGINIRYVGFQNTTHIIPQGTIIRLSLANWWDGDGSGEKRCYLQLSGWY